MAFAEEHYYIKEIPGPFPSSPWHARKCLKGLKSFIMFITLWIWNSLLCCCDDKRWMRCTLHLHASGAKEHAIIFGITLRCRRDIYKRALFSERKIHKAKLLDSYFLFLKWSGEHRTGLREMWLILGKFFLPASMVFVVSADNSRIDVATFHAYVHRIMQNNVSDCTRPRQFPVLKP